MSGIGGITIQSSSGAGGVVAYSNAMSYSGTTTIQPGATLQLGSGGTLGSLSTASQITDNGTLAFSRSNQVVEGVDFCGSLAGNGGLLQLGPGTTTLGGSNTYAGSTLVAGGTLNVAAAGSLNGTGNINATGGGVLLVNGAVTVAGSQTFGIGSGIAGKTGLVVVNSGGSLAIGATTATRLSGGAYQLVGIGPYDGPRQRHADDQRRTVSVAANGASSTSGPGGLDDTALWLNAYQGSTAGTSAINLNGGVLSTARAIANGSATVPAIVNFNGGTVQAAKSENLFTTNGGPMPLYLEGGRRNHRHQRLQRDHRARLLDGGGGGLTVVGSGSLTLSDTASSFSGNLTVSSGTLIANVTASLSNPTTSAWGIRRFPGDSSP